MNNPRYNPLKNLADLILKHEASLTFTILEIGALPVESEPEPFHQLLDLFPGSRVLAFEVDKALCEKLNKTARRGMEFFATALGRTEETRNFYETRTPMNSSLYEPNERLLSLYNNFEVSYLKSVGTIETVSLDHFASKNDIRSVDFIKIDIQGAELDVFQGGRNVLNQIVAMICEVEFIPQYVNQPLFGDVCAFLKENDIMFHRFLWIAGRSLSPIVIRNNTDNATQHIWADAVFIKDIFKVPELTPHKLLKLGVLAFLFDSPDLAYHCFEHYDKLTGTALKDSFIVQCNMR